MDLHNRFGRRLLCCFHCSVCTRVWLSCSLAQCWYSSCSRTRSATWYWSTTHTWTSRKIQSDKSGWFAIVPRHLFFLNTYFVYTQGLDQVKMISKEQIKHSEAYTSFSQRCLHLAWTPFIVKQTWQSRLTFPQFLSPTDLKIRPGCA